MKMGRLFVKTAFFFLVGTIGFGFNNAGLTADQILKKAEAKLSSSTMIVEVDITIKRPRWTKNMSLKTWSKGTDYALAYVTGPERDKGIVYLKTGNDVYNYLPKIKKTVKLPAILLSQNWMGTDMSTDDLIKLTNLTKDYKASLTGSATVSSRDCHVITLIPKPEADVLWGKLVISIDKKEYIQMKTVFYDEDLEVVNTMVSSNVKNLGGKQMASQMVMTPAGKAGQSTTVIYKSIKFNSPIDNAFFTKANMAKVKP
ncbi:MAG: outer membrane lipoprotein-sorting protein [Bacteroidetes bacterium]|nr:MAG: outer membrane lipoprotein-sorting protein [Bacteroidota bacterium]